jgi:GTP cyclohydrolase I
VGLAKMMPSFRHSSSSDCDHHLLFFNGLATIKDYFRHHN